MALFVELNLFPPQTHAERVGEDKATFLAKSKKICKINCTYKLRLKLLFKKGFIILFYIFKPIVSKTNILELLYLWVGYDTTTFLVNLEKKEKRLFIIRVKPIFSKGYALLCYTFKTVVSNIHIHIYTFNDTLFTSQLFLNLTQILKCMIPCLKNSFVLLIFSEKCLLLTLDIITNCIFIFFTLLYY